MAVVSTATLAGGFSHETSLLDTGHGLVVVRLGGQDRAVEGQPLCRWLPHRLRRAHPADLVPNEDWSYLGHVLDMFALSDLVTRPPGHPVADQAAQQIMRRVAGGVPRG